MKCTLGANTSVIAPSYIPLLTVSEIQNICSILYVPGQLSTHIIMPIWANEFGERCVDMYLHAQRSCVSLFTYNKTHTHTPTHLHRVPREIHMLEWAKVQKMRFTACETLSIMTFLRSLTHTKLWLTHTQSCAKACTHTCTGMSFTEWVVWAW